MKRSLIFIFFVPISASNAFAHSITVQLGSFVGRYTINSGGHNIGNKVFSLNSGAHTFQIVGGGSTSFTVNSDGTVTPSNSTIFSSSGSTLTLNTIPIYFDLNGYDNIYNISLGGNQAASGTYYLPITLSVSLGIPGTNNIATITAEPTGYVSVSSGTDKVSGAKDQVIFNTVDVIVDAGNYDGVFAFDGKGFMSGVTSHKLFPNATYTLKSNSANVIGTIQTNDTHLASSTTGKLKTSGNTVYLYTNRYSITPPSGYNGQWQVTYQGNNTGTASEWLLPGVQARFYVASTTYYFTADTNCTSFTLSTSVGTFNFSCESAISLIFPNVDEDELNALSDGFSLYRTDGRLSTVISDYSLTVNGSSHALTGATLTNDTLSVRDAFEEGRNAIVLDGEDADSNTFQLTPAFWAGTSEIQVVTTGATDTVTLEVEQTIGSTLYSKNFVKTAMDYKVTFKNVPSADGITINVTSSRGASRTIRAKLPRVLLINM